VRPPSLCPSQYVADADAASTDGAPPNATTTPPAAGTASSTQCDDLDLAEELQDGEAGEAARKAEWVRQMTSILASAHHGLAHVHRARGALASAEAREMLNRAMAWQRGNRY
jgi:hypothetical protein